MNTTVLTLCAMLVPIAPATGGPEGADLLRLLPAELDGGWKIVKGPTIFDPEHLADHINGEAEAFLIYDVGDTVTARYEAEGRGQVEVDVYHMKTLACAFGVYGERRPVEPDLLPLGAQGFAAPRATRFFNGPYFVEARALSPKPDAAKATQEVATALAKLVPGDGKFPAELSLLPDKGRVPNSEGFALQAYLNIQAMPPFFKARYRSGEAKAELGIGLAGDADKAQAAMQRILDYAKTLGVEEGQLPAGQPQRIEANITYVGWLRAELIGVDLAILTSGASPYPEADALFAEAARKVTEYRSSAAGKAA